MIFITGPSIFLVGTAGFELATPCTPCKCATRLRYAPKENVTIAGKFWFCTCNVTFFMKLALFFIDRSLIEQDIDPYLRPLRSSCANFRLDRLHRPRNAVWPAR